MTWSADHLEWRRACASGACVEVAVTDTAVHMRDSTNPDREHLTFDRAVWEDFLQSIRAGEFDIPAR